MKPNNASTRREFMGALTLGATTMIASLSENATASGRSMETMSVNDTDEWFKKIKGKQRIVYDASEPHGGMPIIWSWVFYKTNNETGTPDNDMTAVVVLRHNAIPFAMEDSVWSKYKMGEIFHVNDPQTSSPSLRNPYWTPREGDFPLKDAQGIQALQKRGVLFCICDMALTVFSGFVSQGMNQKAEEVKKDWVKGILPGIQIVPSGVWAIARAQQKGCAYCYAGG